MTAADLMTRRPVVIQRDCSVTEALNLLDRLGVPQLYVVDKSRRLMGILTDYEVIKARLNGEHEDVAAADLMSRAIPVFAPETDAAVIASLLREARYTEFPVVNGGRLVGVIGRREIIRLMAVLQRFEVPASGARTKKPVPQPKFLEAKHPARRKRAVPVAGGSTKRLNPRPVGKKSAHAR